MTNGALLAQRIKVDSLYYDITSSTTVSVTFGGREYSSYKEVTIPSSIVYGDSTYRVTSIHSSAFAQCYSLSQVTIPNTIISIGSNAFEQCVSLRAIVIPNSVESIGIFAFNACSSLETIVISNNIQTIAEWAFKGTRWYDNQLDGPIYLGNVLYGYKGDMPQNTSIDIAEGTISITPSAFNGCTSLISISLPNSLKIIGGRAFYACSSLSSITIPESITNIEKDAFGGCKSLTSVIWNSKNCIDFSDKYYAPFYNNHSIITSFTFGEYVEHIPSYLCYEMQNLTTLLIPSSVSSIGENSFCKCGSLNSITIGKKILAIGANAFNECTELIDVNYLGDIVGWCKIKFNTASSNPMYYAHKIKINNQELNDLILPNTIQQIGDYAFYQCSTIKSITCEAENPPIVGYEAFYNISKYTPIYVPCGYVDTYRSTHRWGDFVYIQEPLARYSINVRSLNNDMGTTQVDKNTICGNLFSATSNYGYHFVQWNDNNTDNPRTIELTQDTFFIAEFSPNKYKISTQSNDPDRGTTKGDTTAHYAELIEISAIANYGYHFAYWNDDHTSNPRQVKVAEDKTYTAYFSKNIYQIVKNANAKGYIEGKTSAEYLDYITLEAIPHCGYYFTQWSDGVTDNPRTFVLTQDTSFNADFAQTTFGQCGDKLYWNFTNNRLIITGIGEMYDYELDCLPWTALIDSLLCVEIRDGITNISKNAFANCIKLNSITLPNSLEIIDENAFNGCRTLYDIYCYAKMPPIAAESSFTNYNAYVYIPCESQRYYQADMIWSKFKNLQCLTSDNTIITAPSINTSTVKKILHNGHLFILREGKTYTIMGLAL